MPVVVGIAVTIASTLEATAVGLAGVIGATLAGTFGTTAMMIGWAAVSIGASFAFSEIGKALAPGPSLPTSVMQAAAPRQTVYGQMRVAGVYAYVGTSNGGSYLNMVIMWASHQVQSIDTIYLDGRAVILSGNTDDGQDHYDDSGNKYNFHGNVEVDHSLGTVPGTYLASLGGQDGNWSSTCTLDGIAASYIRCNFDATIFPSEPQTVAVIHGKNDIYDPRMNSGAGGTGYTNNAALVIADVLMNPDYGLGCTQAEIDMDQLTAAANLCDEQVTLANGLTESRYTLNGYFDTSSAPGDIIDAMLQCCAGRISYSGGQWKIFPGAWYGSSLTFDDSDLVGPLKWLPRRKYRDLCNAVRATYISPKYPYAVVGYNQDHKDPNIFSGQWQPTDAPEYAQDTLHGYPSDANLAADGNVKLYHQLPLRFVTSVSMAQRVMKIYLLRNRFQGTGILKMSLAAYQCVPQDNIQMTFPALSWAGKYLEVQSMRFVAGDSGDGSGSGDQHSAPALQVELTVAETDPSVYLWSAAEELGPQDTQSPALADAYTVAPPSGLTLESGADSAVVGVDGVVIPRIHVTWTEPQDPFTLSGGSVEVQWQPQGGTYWNSVGYFAATTTEYYLAGVVCGQVYNVRVRAIRANGACSAFDEADGHTVSTTTSSISVGHIVGLGALATLNNVDFATSQVVNKTLGNVADGGGWYKVANVDPTTNQTNTASYLSGSISAEVTSAGAGQIIAANSWANVAVSPNIATTSNGTFQISGGFFWAFNQVGGPANRLQVDVMLQGQSVATYYVEGFYQPSGYYAQGNYTLPTTYASFSNSGSGYYVIAIKVTADNISWYVNYPELTVGISKA